MVSEYFQNSMLLSANKLKRYINMMTTLKIQKAISSIYDVKKVKQIISSVSGKLTTLGLFVENED